MRSYLLTSLTGVLTVAALIIGLALLVKGHDEPGGGFVAGLAVALSVVLLLAGLGAPWVRRHLPVEPEQLLLVGVGVLFVAAGAPIVFGEPALTQASGEVVLPLFGPSSWHTSLVFDIGVALCVGGGFGTAALVLWEQLVAWSGGELAP